jgi:hypothetical protein
LNVAELLLAVIALALFWALVKWRNDAAQAERRIQHKKQKCADTYNVQLRANYRKWFDSMTKEGYSPSFLSDMRKLTPDEIGVEEWQTPEEYLKMDPDWHRHPDYEELIAKSYTDEQREEMKQPDWQLRRKLRRRGSVP